MDALQELRAELYTTAAEQFVKEYQTALDSVRRTLAIYVDPCAMSVLTSRPQPISDDYTTGEKVDALGIQHDQQLVEVEHILNFILDNYLTRPGVANAEQIAFAVERFLNNLQRATDSYTVKLGISPYQNRSPYGDSMMMMMQNFQQLNLRAADCGTGGEGGRGATEIDHDASKTKTEEGPSTKERRSKKKKNGSRKRAEKNRILGVKKVKLLPILQTKKTSYNRQYLHRKCNEGEMCNFPHDTVPLTKSKLQLQAADCGSDGKRVDVQPKK